MTMANETILMQGHSQAERRTYDLAIASLPDAADYEIRSADGRWWVVYTARGCAPDHAIRSAAMADLHAAADRIEAARR